ncbi:hypothetical protein BK370_23760 [Escherichia coli]|nr:hypothetical protein BK370_23760 [Escherichia coli]
MKWFNTLSHNRWLEQETDRIFDFGKNSVVPTGFGWLGNKGQIKEEMGTHLWITARMLHVYSVAAAMGRPGAYSLVDHGIKAMNGALRDKKYGGWYACVNDEGVVDASKLKKGPKAQLFCSQITKNPDKSGPYITEPYNRNCGLEHFPEGFFQIPLRRSKSSQYI